MAVMALTAGGASSELRLGAPPAEGPNELRDSIRFQPRRQLRHLETTIDQ